MMKRVSVLAFVVLFCVATSGECPNNNNGNNNNNNSNDNLSIALNVVKLDIESTNDRGPAVGDGVLAFNADGNAILAWLRAGDTAANEVPEPSGMHHDSSAYAFGGKKLVVRDRTSGGLFVFDTDTEEVAPIPTVSINMGGSIGPNLWEVDGDFIATVNSTVTTDDGAGLRVKMVDISDVNNFVITPFTVDPGAGSPDAIDIDTAGRQIAVRVGDTFYFYDMDNPDDAPAQVTRTTLSGGTGENEIQLEGDFLAFYDDDDNLVMLDRQQSVFVTPSRNPARANRGLFFEEDRFAYFANETEDDGSTISVLNRLLVGHTDDISDLLDPAGAFINGEDDTDGRIGFGATADISPNGRFVFVAGETIVEISAKERLYLSVDGGKFKFVEDASDSLNALRAAGVSCSNNLVAFLIPIDPDTQFSPLTVGYAELPPP